MSVHFNKDIRIEFLLLCFISAYNFLWGSLWQFDAASQSVMQTSKIASTPLAQKNQVEMSPRSWIGSLLQALSSGLTHGMIGSSATAEGGSARAHNSCHAPATSSYLARIRPPLGHFRACWVSKGMVSPKHPLQVLGMTNRISPKQSLRLSLNLSMEIAVPTLVFGTV